MFNRLIFNYRNTIYTTAACSAAASLTRTSLCSENDGDHLKQQPSFLGTTNLKRPLLHTFRPQGEVKTLNDMAIITGSAHPELAKDIADLLGLPLTQSKMSRFADGEVAINIDESIRGKNVFIVQPCAAPVNDSIMELLLAVSCANRAAAGRVIAVIPYFGYKHHRRSTSPMSNTFHSRFLSSFAMDLARMLQEMGVDHVITVDLQRPGQGHEACFFNNAVPLETVITKELLAWYFVDNVPLSKSVVVISPNTECVKKAKNFQLNLKAGLPDTDVQFAMFDALEVDGGPSDPESKVLLGNVQIAGADVVIVDDMVDTAGTLAVLARRLQHMGAANIHVCASHGLFTERSMDLIRDTQALRRVVVTDSLPLPPGASEKVFQVSVAPMLAQLMLMEHFRARLDETSYEATSE